MSLFLDNVLILNKKCWNYLYVSFIGSRNTCALATINKLPRILVANADGYLYIYNVDPAEGQECTLLRQFP